MDIATGLRRGELLGLRWQDIKGSHLTVNQSLVKVGRDVIVQTPKSAKGARRIGLSPDLVAVLGDHRRRQDVERATLGGYWPNTGLVFVSETGSSLDPDNLKRVRQRLMKSAGVPSVRLHDLRHLHSSLCIRQGMDPKVLADRLGHARASFTLDRYTHLFEEQREQAVVSLTDFLAPAQSMAN